MITKKGFLHKYRSFLKIIYPGDGQELADVWPMNWKNDFPVGFETELMSKPKRTEKMKCFNELFEIRKRKFRELTESHDNFFIIQSNRAFSATSGKRLTPDNKKNKIQHDEHNSPPVVVIEYFNDEAGFEFELVVSPGTGNRRAFLEMADELSASEMVSYFTTCAAQLRGRAVFVQFSNHKELKTDQTHSNANASAQAALQAAQALSGNVDTQGGPNTVLRVIIEHMVYPVTLDVLYKLNFHTLFGKRIRKTERGREQEREKYGEPEGEIERRKEEKRRELDLDWKNFIWSPDFS
ncbi:hypothetical protein RUM43_006789 [Polyplax serrata]|uniref:Uncharacterized protein n=1 Tax=Polyplax serrata TaxID=468196 RepID=A0AAN8S7G3_POLSC